MEITTEPTPIRYVTTIFAIFAACSPVLLPSRVVQALNLNVHELGLQIKPPKGCHFERYNIGLPNF